MITKIRRARGPNGQFICLNSTSRSNESLANHILCQKAYISRRKREKEPIFASFLRDFLVKDQDKAVHWLPGS